MEAAGVPSRAGDYERSFALFDAVDPSGIEARMRGGVLRLRLPKAGPAQRQRIEVRADWAEPPHPAIPHPA
jgi:HSP20 family molecular chaperone IbpA